MNWGEITVADIALLLLGILASGGLAIFIFKRKSKDRNYLKGNTAGGSIAGGSIFKGPVSQGAHASQNKNTLKNNTAGGDIAAGDIFKDR